MTEIDPIAIDLVALDGHRMRLKKEERLEAIKIMTKHKVSRQHMAWRLCITVDSLERVAREANIKLPPTVPPAHWSVYYFDKRDREQQNAAARERARRRRERNSNKKS